MRWIQERKKKWKTPLSSWPVKTDDHEFPAVHVLNAERVHCESRYMLSHSWTNNGPLSVPIREPDFAVAEGHMGSPLPWWQKAWLPGNSAAWAPAESILRPKQLVKYCQFQDLFLKGSISQVRGFPAFQDLEEDLDEARGFVCLHIQIQMRITVSLIRLVNTIIKTTKCYLQTTQKTNKEIKAKQINKSKSEIKIFIRFH